MKVVVGHVLVFLWSMAAIRKGVFLTLLRASVSLYKARTYLWQY